MHPRRVKGFCGRGESQSMSGVEAKERNGEGKRIKKGRTEVMAAGNRIGLKVRRICGRRWFC